MTPESDDTLRALQRAAERRRALSADAELPRHQRQKHAAAWLGLTEAIAIYQSRHQ